LLVHKIGISITDVPKVMKVACHDLSQYLSIVLSGLVAVFLHKKPSNTVTKTLERMLPIYLLNVKRKI